MGRFLIRVFPSLPDSRRENASSSNVLSQPYRSKCAARFNAASSWFPVSILSTSLVLKAQAVSRAQLLPSVLSPSSPSFAICNALSYTGAFLPASQRTSRAFSNQKSLEPSPGPSWCAFSGRRSLRIGAMSGCHCARKVIAAETRGACH